MVAIPKSIEQRLIEKIYGTYETIERDRGYYLGRLGASFLGEECLRKTWLSWRAYSRGGFNGRMLRLFATGHSQEERIVADLRDAGLSVWDRDEKTGEQLEFVDKTGHFIVKLDGVVKSIPEVEEIPHVLEIKTHNKSSFSSLLKKGLVDAKPEHYVQLQAGMMMSGLSDGLYVALCKDDEQFYIERVQADEAVQTAAQKKIIKLVSATMKPAGISDSGEGYVCKFCSARQVCIGQEPPVKTCRSCVHARADTVPGEWVCELKGETLSKKAQLLACEEYVCL
jgi:hypothetical protein